MTAPLFIPAPRQAAIFTAFDALPPGGTLQIDAVAGSGKTTTLLQLLARLPQHQLRDTILCAFGRDIRDELKKRAPSECTVKTIHGIGYGALSYHFKRSTGRYWDPQCDDSTKYSRLTEYYWQKYCGKDPNGERSEAQEAMGALLRMVRVTLTDWTDKGAVDALCLEREIDTPDFDQMFEALQGILLWAQHGLPKADHYGYTYAPTEWIDYTDQLWLPHVFNITPYPFGTVLVDECQDLSPAQLALVKKVCRRGGRMIFVGDPYQAIFAFAGADANSFRNITASTNAVVMPLDVCYRCPRAVVEFAQLIVPTIQPAPNASEGILQPVPDSFFDEQVKPDDMVLCRTTGPLITKAFQLIRQGKRARVKGRDIGASLKKVVDSIKKLDGFTFKDFIAYTGRWRAIQIEVLERKGKEAAEAAIMSVCDKADSVIAVYEAVVEKGGTTVADLRAEIENLFTDDGSGFILLSTIHRAKGGEAERVFLLHPELLPHPMAKSDAAREQEMNLKYVAYTRAKKALYLVMDGAKLAKIHQLALEMQEAEAAQAG